jgi:hypothetical protein
VGIERYEKKFVKLNVENPICLVSRIRCGGRPVKESIHSNLEGIHTYDFNRFILQIPYSGLFQNMNTQPKTVWNDGSHPGLTIRSIYEIFKSIWYFVISIYHPIGTGENRKKRKSSRWNISCRKISVLWPSDSSKKTNHNNLIHSIP